MKRKTFYYISLSLPYIALICTGALAFSAYEMGMDWATFSGLGGMLAGTVVLFLTSAVVWGPLYTWMVIVMLFWSRGKNADELRRAYLLLPVLFGCSMGIPAIFLYMDSSVVLLSWGFLHLANLDFIARLLFEYYSLEESLSVGVAWALMAALCLAVGYMFVGIVLLVEKSMKRWNLFEAEEGFCPGIEDREKGVADSVPGSPQ